MSREKKTNYYNIYLKFSEINFQILNRTNYLKSEKENLSLNIQKNKKFKNKIIIFFMNKKKKIFITLL